MENDWSSVGQLVAQQLQGAISQMTKGGGFGGGLIGGLASFGIGSLIGGLFGGKSKGTRADPVITWQANAIKAEDIATAFLTISQQLQLRGAGLGIDQLNNQRMAQGSVLAGSGV